MHTVRDHEEFIQLVEKHYPDSKPKALGMGFTVWLHKNVKVAVWDAIEKVGTITIPG